MRGNSNQDCPVYLLGQIENPGSIGGSQKGRVFLPGSHLSLRKLDPIDRYELWQIQSGLAVGHGSPKNFLKFLIRVGEVNKSGLKEAQSLLQAPPRWRWSAESLSYIPAITIAL